MKTVWIVSLTLTLISLGVCVNSEDTGSHMGRPDVTALSTKPFTTLAESIDQRHDAPDFGQNILVTGRAIEETRKRPWKLLPREKGPDPAGTGEELPVSMEMASTPCYVIPYLSDAFCPAGSGSVAPVSLVLEEGIWLVILMEGGIFPLTIPFEDESDEFIIER